MNKQRALYLLENPPQGDGLPCGLRYAFESPKGRGHRSVYQDGITKREDKFIMKIWEGLSKPTATYSEALEEIAGGLVEKEDRPAESPLHC